MNTFDDKSTLVQVIVTIRHQAITWANVNPDLCHHMAALAHNELSYGLLIVDKMDSGIMGQPHMYLEEN